MMTLQGMADHRFTSVSLFTNVFLGEIIYLRPSLPLNAKNCYGLFEVLWKGLAAGCHSKKLKMLKNVGSGVALFSDIFSLFPSNFCT